MSADERLSLTLIRVAARDLLRAIEAHREIVWNMGDERDLSNLHGFVKWFAKEIQLAAGGPSSAGRDANECDGGGG